jgi:hypothetical protein
VLVVFDGWRERRDNGEIEKIKAVCRLGTIKCDARFEHFPCSLFSDTEGPETNGDPPDTRAANTATLQSGYSTGLGVWFSRYGVLGVHRKEGFR